MKWWKIVHLDQFYVNVNVNFFVLFTIQAGIIA